MEFGNRGISGPMKRTYVLQNFKKKVWNLELLEKLLVKYDDKLYQVDQY